MDLRVVRGSIILGLAAVALTAVLSFVSGAAAQGTGMAPGDALVVKGRSTNSLETSTKSDQDLLLVALKAVGLATTVDRGKLKEIYDHAAGAPTTIDFTVYLKGNRVRMDYGASSLLGGLQDEAQIEDVMALGRWMVRGGTAAVKGRFEG
jgi:hypothetical protein